MSGLTNRFWSWYEQHYLLNVSIALGLFLLQIIHLIWLFGDIVVPRLGGPTLFGIEGLWSWLLILVDYTEIPAIISVSLVYTNELRKKFSWQPVFYLLALNSQWIHIFWITDEFVVDAFTGKVFSPLWLTWIAIGIDYLEVPVIIATARKFFEALRERRIGKFLTTELRD